MQKIHSVSIVRASGLHVDPIVNLGLPALTQLHEIRLVREVGVNSQTVIMVLPLPLTAQMAKDNAKYRTVLDTGLRVTHYAKRPTT